MKIHQATNSGTRYGLFTWTTLLLLILILPAKVNVNAAGPPVFPVPVQASNSVEATLVSPLTFLISNVLAGDNITIDLTNHAGKLSAIRIHSTGGGGNAGGTNARQFGTLTLTNLSGNPNVATNILGSGAVTVTSNNLGEWTISVPAADSGGTNARQFGSAVLSNLVLTVANNVTNFISLSTSNATSKPLTNSYANGVVRIFGLEPGTGMSLSVNSSNIVITSTVDAGGTNSRQFGTLVLTNLSNTGAITNLNDTQFVDEGTIATIKAGAFLTNFNGWGDFTNLGTIWLDAGDIIPISDGAWSLGQVGNSFNRVAVKSGGLVLLETGGGVDFIKIVAPNSIASSFTLLLPDSQGPDGAVITNNGSGVLGWWIPGIETNANQFGQSRIVTIKDGPYLTNIIAFGSGNITNAPGLDRKITFWNTNSQGYTAISGPTNQWLPTNRFFLYVTNPVAGQVLKILNSTYANGVASIVLTNDTDSTGGGGLTTNANQFGPSVELALKDGLKITNAASFGVITNMGSGTAMVPENTDSSGLGTIDKWYGDVFLNRLRLVDQSASGFDIQLQAPTLGASWQMFLPDTLTMGALTNDGAGQSGWYDLSNISGDAGGTNARQFGTLSLTNLSGNPNVATNILGAGFATVSSNNAGVWTITGRQSGETNFNGEVSVTNSTRIGLVNGKSANTNLLRSVQGGNGIVLTNEGTNVMAAIDPAVVATVAWANSISNLAQTKQNGAALLTNLVNNPYTGYTNQVFGGTNISIRTAGGTNFIDTVGHLNNWSQIPTGEMANVVSTTFLTNWANAVSNYVTSATNSASVTNWINSRQPASTTLSNLSGTGAVTNLFTPSLSNGTIKPIVFGGVGNAAGMTNTSGRLYGLEAGANVTLTPNGSNIVVASSPGAADSLWSSNNITIFPGMYTNRVAIGTNQTQDGVQLYVVGYSQSFPGAETFENYAQGSGSEANGMTVMLKPDTGYAGSQSYCFQSRNDVNNRGGTLAVLTGDVASYGIDCLNTGDETGSKIVGATCAIQGYAGSANSINLGVSGVGFGAKATTTNIALAGVLIKSSGNANTKDIGLYTAFKTTAEITTPATIVRSAVGMFDSWTSNVPLLVLQTNNGNIVVYVDNAGNVILTNTVFARVSAASPTLSVTNFPGLDRQLTFWNTNGNGYTAISGPTNTWNPTNRFFLTVTNVVAGQVLKVLSVSYDSGVASIVLTNDSDLNPTLTSNANQLASVPLAIKESALLTNTIHYSSDTNRTNISINQRIGQLVPVLSVRGSNDAPLVEVDNAGYILLTNNLTARAATPTNTIALGAEDYGGLSFPTWTEGHGLEFNLQPSLHNSRIYMLSPSSGTAIGAVGTAAPVTTGGTTISHTTPDELQPSMVQIASATSSNSSAGIAMTNNLANAGAHDGSSKMGGYFYSCEWSITNFIAGVVGGGAPRAFVGLANAASPDLTNIVQTTNATGQYIGLMLDAKQSLNMFVTCRDASAEFRTNTGVNFVATNLYQFSMFNAHTSRFVGWRLKSITDGTEAKGWFSNNVPTNFMKGTILSKNGTNRANDIRMSKMYLMAPISPN